MLILALYTFEGSSPSLQSSAEGVCTLKGSSPSSQSSAEGALHKCIIPTQATLAKETAEGYTLCKTGEIAYKNHPIDGYYTGSVAQT